MTTILKLGGSVITDKDTPETVDERRLEALATAIGTHSASLVVVHGGGSFGHHHAAKYGVNVTEGTDDPVPARAIHGAMVTLNESVVDALAAADAPALPVHPLSIGSRDSDGELTFPTGAIERLLAAGFVPVLHGDVIAHAGAGVTVLSGDELVARLARTLGADRIGVCSTVPGVLDEAGNVIDRIDAMADVTEVLGDSEATDVTGGMAGKVAALLELDSPAHVFGPENVANFLSGEQPGTTIYGP